ncbi:metalloregulator ArsR/SmtB family transcription factor [bacterium]|nr:metalloregulator ArsR/SmtB family transcription factor [bacterium]
MADLAKELEVLEDIAERLRTLGHPVRLMIVSILKTKRHNVGELSEKLGLSIGSTSQHLKVMERAGLVHGEREGRFVHYSVRTPMVGDICAAICRHMEAEFDDASEARASFDHLRQKLQG